MRYLLKAVGLEVHCHHNNDINIVTTKHNIAAKELNIIIISLSADKTKTPAIMYKFP